MLTLLLFLSFRPTSAIASVTLNDAYQAALKRNEDVANQIELVNQAEERYKQALGAIAPTVNFVGTYTKQDAGSQAASIYPTDQKTYKLAASQPLFQGFRDFAALKQESILSDVARYTRDQALIQLYQDVTTAYFQVVTAEKDYKDLLTEIGVNQNRLKDIIVFKRIGRSRDTDVLTIQANIASLEVQVETSKALINTTRSVFAFLTDLPANEVLSDTFVSEVPLDDVKHYLDQIPSRPDIMASGGSEEAADRGVTIARGGHLPTLALGADYYFARPGALEDVKWDATLNLTFPIFQGGIINSEVRVAASQLKQADLALSKARRQATEQVQTFYDQVVGDLKQIEKQRSAVDLSQKNYESEVRDYKFGLVTNLEVLQALTTAQESARQMDHLWYQYKTDYLKLQSSVVPYATLAKGLGVTQN